MAVGQRPRSANEFENGGWTWRHVGPVWRFGMEESAERSKWRLYDPDVIRPIFE